MNADDVRNLMPKSVEETIEEITQKCAKEAKKGHYVYKTYDYGFGETMHTTKKQAEILEGLRHLGFEAKLDINFGQFVDAYLKVSWEEVEVSE